MSGSISVDSIRLSDLSFIGWAGIWLAVGGVTYAVREIVLASVWGGPWLDPILIGGFLALLGAAIAYENAQPECEAVCDHCGAYIRSQSSRDGADEYVKVHASGSPRRARLGPLSLVVRRCRSSFTYCSGDCAAADADSRVLIETVGHESGITAEVDDD